MSFKGLGEWPKERIKLWTKKNFKKMLAVLLLGIWDKALHIKERKTLHGRVKLSLPTNSCYFKMMGKTLELFY